MHIAWGEGSTKRTYKTKLYHCIILEWRIQLQDNIMGIDLVVIEW